MCDGFVALETIRLDLRPFNLVRRALEKEKEEVSSGPARPFPPKDADALPADACGP